MEKRKSVSTRTRFLVLKRAGFKCEYCGASSDEKEMHVDHIKALKNDGENSIDNYAASCSYCNFGKAASDILNEPTKQKTANGFLKGKYFVDYYNYDEVITPSVEPTDGPTFCLEIFHQGIVKEESADNLLVEYFSWLSGDPNGEHIVSAEDAKKYTFFDTEEKMCGFIEKNNPFREWDTRNEG